MNPVAAYAAFEFADWPYRKQALTWQLEVFLGEPLDAFDAVTLSSTGVLSMPWGPAPEDARPPALAPTFGKLEPRAATDCAKGSAHDGARGLHRTSVRELLVRTSWSAPSTRRCVLS